MRTCKKCELFNFMDIDLDSKNEIYINGICGLTGKQINITERALKDKATINFCGKELEKSVLREIK